MSCSSQSWSWSGLASFCHLAEKNGFFFMEKTVLAKIVFASGKNSFCQWQKPVFASYWQKLIF